MIEISVVRVHTRLKLIVSITTKAILLRTGVYRMESIRSNVFIRTSHVQKLQSVVLVTEESVVVVDPGFFPDEIDEIQKHAAQFDGQTKYLILTHSDFDHIAGVHTFSGYKVLAASTWDKNNERRSIQTLEFADTSNYVNRVWSGPMPPITFDRLLDDGEQFAKFTFYHAKGHTSDGLVLVHDRVAIVGDYLSAVEFPFIFTSYIDYLRTLAKLRSVFAAHEIELVIAQHGPAATTTQEIQRRIDLSEDYIRRLENLVRRAISADLDVEATVQQARDFLYDDMPISVGIQSLHVNNVKKIYKELQSKQPS